MIDLKTWRVEIAGLIEHADGQWVKQMARNRTDVGDGFLAEGYYVIRDRDPLYMREFHEILKSGGVTPTRSPANSPNSNAYAERFVRSIIEEGLNRVVPLGERHLREMLTGFVEHYHAERNHQGRDNRLMKPSANVISLEVPVRKRKRLCGALNYYYHEAA